MAEVKPGTRQCDKCEILIATPCEILFKEVASGELLEELLSTELCPKCRKILHGRIKRAVKPK
jgi:hypothetical protein